MKLVWQCEFCKNTYDDPDKAIDCEKKHCIVCWVKYADIQSARECEKVHSFGKLGAFIEKTQKEN